MSKLAKLVKDNFEPCFEMLTDIIKQCPEELWAASNEHSPVWQNIFHTLAGTWIWFRPAGQPFQEPPLGKEIAELEIVPHQAMTKQEVLDFAGEAKARADLFFGIAADEDSLIAPYSFYSKLTNLDVIMGQIRHIQHHVGYCNKILGEMGVSVPWKDADR